MNKTEMTDTSSPKTVEKRVAIPALDMQVAQFEIIGTAPYMQHRFSEKAMKLMMEKQAAGDKATKGKKRVARDFDDDYENAMHRSEDGWCGIPCSALRSAMIDACRLVGFKMTIAKLSLFVEPDGFDRVDGTPLVRIEGKPEKHIGHARNETGVCDIRVRPMWRHWRAMICVKFDGGPFDLRDVANLLCRAGAQVGIGEGRHNSRQSFGMGLGTFRVGTTADRKKENKVGGA